MLKKNSESFRASDFANELGPFRLPNAFAAFATILALIATLSHAGTAKSNDVESTKYFEDPVTDDDRLHWSFQPLEPIEVPNAHSRWVRNEIDAFIFDQLVELKIHPQSQADRRTLIRRLSFDLIGLPPSLDEIEEFVRDSEPLAYERLVDRLLLSPQYGQRWSQHWLDLARFAETDGFEHDKTRPQAWKYRDWVIDAFNSDMSYDEFIRRQIAGDELYPDDESARTATRFCLSGPDMPDINLMEERRHTVLNELTSTVGATVLDLQIGCAQCHDHKYDPISQADFYRMRAVFEPAIALKKNRSLDVFSETSPFKQDSRMMIRGDFRRPGPVVSPGVIRVAAPSGFMLSTRQTKSSEGRRTALANWITNKDNPLTARVIVNRVWQHHFGTGLVDTPSEFGVMGSTPTNEPLLDWLANDLMKHDWSLKRLHRKILSSATYRQRSFLPANASSGERNLWKKAIAEDPDARMLSRYPRWRLQGETIRDAILAAAGRLNLKAGGPGVRPPLPKELVGTLLKNQWVVTKDNTEHDRRSVYLFARRNLRYPIFEAFDRPSANSSCACRNVSTTAPQSLHLLNSAFTLKMSRYLANQIAESTPRASQRVSNAFRRVLGRLPNSDELAAVQKYQGEIQDRDALTHLCLSLFNCNEFVIVD